MTSTEPYQYERLEEPDDIRLLDIHPGTAGDPIVISLRIVSLSAKPDFEALSYVWGDPKATEQIACHGGYLRVTTSLFHALGQLRLPGEQRTIWADAVCINQVDLDEKSLQIQIMHRIYQSCRMCAVWLGPANEHSGVALDIVQTMGEIVCERQGIRLEELEGHLKTDGRDSFQTLQIGFHDRLPAINSPAWVSLFHFLRREWFSRVWVVQEAYFSPDVLFHCGDRTIRYGPLFHTADWIINNNGNQILFNAFQEHWATWAGSREWSSEPYTAPHGSNIMSMRPVDYKEKTQSLAQLLHRQRDFNATDPRDKIYGVMHLPPFQREYPSLVPDYRRSVEDIYSDVAFRMLTGENTKDSFVIFTETDVHDEDLDNGYHLPSWVPRWYRKGRPNTGSLWYYLMSTAVSEDAKAASCVTLLSTPGRVLRVRGLEFDVVQDVCGLNFWRPKDGPDARFPMFAPTTPWTPYDPEAARPPYPTKPDIVMAYSMALTSSCREFQGYYSLRCGPENHHHHVADFVAWLMWIRTLQKTPPPHTPHKNFYPPGLYAADQPTVYEASDAELAEKSQRYGLMAWTYNGNRSLVRTRRGYLGTAPNDVKEGDAVCVFMGAAVPFVLRARSGSDAGYVLIGDAYIHGIMDGELVSDWEDAKKQLRDFDIH